MIVAIDPSLEGMAVVIGDILGEQFEAYRCGEPSLGTSPRAYWTRRERIVANVLNALDKHQGQEIDAVWLEGYAYGSQRQTDLAHLGGMLRYNLLDFHPTYREVNPMTLKLFTTGKGRADKIHMKAAIEQKYRVGFQTDDEYDAYAIWRFGLVAGGHLAPRDHDEIKGLESFTRKRVKRKRKRHTAGPGRPAKNKSSERQGRLELEKPPF